MSIIISDFSKGWQNQATQEDMVENGLFKVVDMDFDVAGAITCRGLNIAHDPLSGLDEVDPIESMYGISVEGEDVRRIYLTVGYNLYIASSLSGISFEDTSKSVFTFLLGCIVGLLIMTYIPQVVMFVPNLFY